MTNYLPELKSGDVLITKTGRTVTVVKLSGKKARRILECDEPGYRLEYNLGNGKKQTGHKVWTLDELNNAGVTLA